MARWKQVYNKELGKSEFIPVDEAARKRDGVAIHGLFEPYVSPVDGTVISDPKSLREHNARNGVVHTAEFDQKFLDEKRKERERLYKGEHTPAESLARKQEIYENIMRHERAN